jgi:hypothetical protein
MPGTVDGIATERAVDGIATAGTADLITVIAVITTTSGMPTIVTVGIGGIAITDEITTAASTTDSSFPFGSEGAQGAPMRLPRVQPLAPGAVRVPAR